MVMQSLKDTPRAVEHLQPLVKCWEQKADLKYCGPADQHALDDMRHRPERGQRETPDARVYVMRPMLHRAACFHG